MLPQISLHQTFNPHQLILATLFPKVSKSYFCCYYTLYLDQITKGSSKSATATATATALSIPDSVLSEMDTDHLNGKQNLSSIHEL